MNPHFQPVTTRPSLLACLTLSGMVLASNAMADAAPSHGELAAAIRSANLPCAHVIGVSQASEGKWAVRCNSGTFLVTRGQDGQLSAAGSD
jgi:hypothetical protein